MFKLFLIISIFIYVQAWDFKEKFKKFGDKFEKDFNKSRDEANKMLIKNSVTQAIMGEIKQGEQEAVDAINKLFNMFKKRPSQMTLPLPEDFNTEQQQSNKSYEEQQQQQFIQDQIKEFQKNKNETQTVDMIQKELTKELTEGNINSERLQEMEQQVRYFYKQKQNPTELPDYHYDNKVIQSITRPSEEQRVQNIDTNQSKTWLKGLEIFLIVLGLLFLIIVAYKIYVHKKYENLIDFEQNNQSLPDLNYVSPQSKLYQ